MRKSQQFLLLVALVSTFSGCAILGELLKPVPVPTPTPIPTPTPTPATSCILNGSGKTITPIEGRSSVLGQHVNDAIVEVTGCEVGNNECVVMSRPQDFMKEVNQRLISKGFCAGQDIPGESDEIRITIKTSGVAYNVWEGHHIYIGPGWDDPMKTGKVLWFSGSSPKSDGNCCVGSYRGSVSVK